MDVTCERCSTEYEFDDALVSERGTTVKCTNCGFQFKVRRGEQANVLPETWVVRTVDGRELEFRALRELQNAIGTAQITRDDVLSRGGSRPRRLGSIAELEPFFTSAGMTSHNMFPATAQGIGPNGEPSRRIRTPTPLGLGAVVPPVSRTEGSVAIPLPLPPDAPRAAMRSDAALPAPPPPSYEDTTAVVPPMVPRRAPSIPPPQRATPLPPPPPSIEPATQRIERSSASTLPFENTVPEHAASQPPVHSPVPVRAFQSTLPMETTPPVRKATLQGGVARDLPAPTPPPRAGSVPPPLPSPPPPEVDSDPNRRSSYGSLPTPTPAAVRASYAHEDSLYQDPRFGSVPPPTRRASSSRWIAMLVILGVGALGVVTVGRKYLPMESSKSDAPDEKIVALLNDGERALADGDLDQSKEEFDKASALAEKNPRVAADVAKLAVVRADSAWLRKRLLASDDPDQATVKRELDALAERATKAADAAAAIKADDPAVVRARIDAARERGDLDGARKLVSSLKGGSATTDNALTLAALDLAEDKPSWTTVVDRLRAATSAEQNLGRARSMLIYALARSGDAAGAKAEFEKLAALPRPNPLTQTLRAFLARADGGRVVDVDSLPAANGTTNGGTNEPTDYRDMLIQAEKAHQKGDNKRAEELYEKALAKDPGSSEAIAGLADVARAKHDNAKAAQLYEQLLAKNPQYVPALAALADIKWDRGDRAGAVALYKQVLEHDRSSPAAARAEERTKEHAEAQVHHANGNDEGRVPDNYVAPQNVDTSDLPGAKNPPPTPPTPPTDTAPKPPSNVPPGVDTSDLPGFH